MAHVKFPQIAKRKRRPYVRKAPPATPTAIWLTLAQVAERFHLTQRAIDWRVRKNKFPKPYPFSHKNRLWRISDIEAYEAKARPTAQVLSSN